MQPDRLLHLLGITDYSDRPRSRTRNPSREVSCVSRLVRHPLTKRLDCRAEEEERRILW